MQYKIGKLIADNLVEDGSTLQAGIGVIPDAVMANLKGHKGLGVHSEMFSNGMIDLIQSGAITNEFVGVTRRVSRIEADGHGLLFDLLRHGNGEDVMACSVIHD